VLLSVAAVATQQQQQLVHAPLQQLGAV